VELVFKEGVAYDPAALIAASEGTVGQYDVRQMFRWPFNVLFVALLALLVTRRIARRRRPQQASARPAIVRDTPVPVTARTLS
jgi:hypothetical protein